MALTYGQVASDILTECGFTLNANNMESMLAWMCSEYWISVPLQNRALNNPLDTTQPYAGATDFNSDGVKNYATYADGLIATKQTLFNGSYQSIINSFKLSLEPSATVLAIYNSPWGSKPTAGTVQLVQNQYQAVYNTLANTSGEDTMTTTEVTDEPTTSATGTEIAAPIVAGCATPGGYGYYLCDSSGGVYCFGDAKFLGSIPGLVEAKKAEAPASPVVDIMVISNSAYYLVTADGAVYSFGAAQFHGAV